MTLDEARGYYSRDRYSTELTGITIDEMGEHMSKCSLVIDSRHLNAAGNVMGAVYYTLADFAFAVAVGASDENPTVTTVGQINYLDVCRGKKLIAVCRALRDGKHMCYYRTDITDENGMPVATAMSSGMHVEV